MHRSIMHPSLRAGHRIRDPSFVKATRGISSLPKSSSTQTDLYLYARKLLQATTAMHRFKLQRLLAAPRVLSGSGTSTILPQINSLV